MWPYGGAGMLLSSAAVEALGGEPFTASSSLNSSPNTLLLSSALVGEVSTASAAARGAAAAARGGSVAATSPTVSAAMAVAAAARESAEPGRAIGQMGARHERGARFCLRQFTCPWGVATPCDAVSPTLVARAHGNRSRSTGLCYRTALKSSGVGSDDCRMCGNTDVQLACCLATRGVFTTDLSALDGRQTPGDAHWSPWAVHLKGYRANPEAFAKQLERVLKCGVASGPGAWRNAMC